VRGSSLPERFRSGICEWVGRSQPPPPKTRPGPSGATLTPHPSILPALGTEQAIRSARRAFEVLGGGARRRRRTQIQLEGEWNSWWVCWVFAMVPVQFLSAGPHEF